MDKFDRDALSAQILSIRIQNGKLSEHLSTALSYIPGDLHSSLTKCRMVIEKILQEIYKIEMGKEPDRGMIGNLLSKKVFKAKIPNRIVARINLVRELGNLGPHGGIIDVEDAFLVLEQTINFVLWFLSEYGVSTKNIATQSCEILPELKEIHKGRLSPSIVSVKFVQERNRCYLEVSSKLEENYAFSPEGLPNIKLMRTDLDFYGDIDEETYVDSPSFDPHKPIEENIKKFLEYDEEGLSYCNGLFAD